MLVNNAQAWGNPKLRGLAITYCTRSAQQFLKNYDFARNCLHRAQSTCRHDDLPFPYSPDPAPSACPSPKGRLVARPGPRRTRNHNSFSITRAGKQARRRHPFPYPPDGPSKISWTAVMRASTVPQRPMDDARLPLAVQPGVQSSAQLLGNIHRLNLSRVPSRAPLPEVIFRSMDFNR